MANGSFLGQKTKITVIRMLKLDDIAAQYGQIRPGEDNGDFIPDCPYFKEGQEFIVETGGTGDCKPAGFCDWAWADIWKDILMTANKAGVTPNGEKSRLDPHFTCCTDGLRPVVFMIQSMETD